MFYFSRPVSTFLLLALTSTSQVNVANGDCDSDIKSLVEDPDFIALAADIIAAVGACAGESTCTSPDYSEAQKKCEDDLDSDWFYYTLTSDCSGVVTSAELPSCLPASCTNDEQFLKESLGADAPELPGCMNTYTFKELSSAAFTPGAIAGSLLAVSTGAALLFV